MALMPKLKLLISFIYEGGPMRRLLTAFIIAIVMIGVSVLFGQNIIETGKTTEQSTELSKKLKELGNQINESTDQPKIINIQSDDSTDQTQVLISTIKGEVIELSCYVNMGAKGESHRQCAIECANNGHPLGLLEDQTGRIFIILTAIDKNTKDLLLPYIAEHVTIDGSLVEKGGMNFLNMQSIEKVKN